MVCKSSHTHKPRGTVEGEGSYPSDHFTTLALFSKCDLKGERGSKILEICPHG